MTEYKVGDKVRILNTEDLRHEYRNEKYAEFHSVTVGGGNSVIIKMNDGNTQHISVEDIELAGPQSFRRKANKAVAGKKYLVLNDEDEDFPEGSIVTAASAENFFPDVDGDTTYMRMYVLLQEVTDEPEELTFIQLIEKLPELAVGTEFKSGVCNVLYVDYQKNPEYIGNKFLYWKSDDSPVAISEAVLGYKFTQLPAEPQKPEYTEIPWQDALQIIADGGTVFADDSKTVTDMRTEFFDELNIGCMDDLVIGTDWYKKAE